MGSREIRDPIVLTDDQKYIAAEALRAAGYLQSASALEAYRPSEIRPHAAALVIGSLMNLAQDGSRPDAQATIDNCPGALGYLED